MALQIDSHNNNIDIVIPWLNPDDTYWQKDYVKYKKLESSGDVADEDFNGECRYRDMGTIKYVLRSIEKNCPWAHKVFLILRDEHQIPDWLDTASSILRIVYHSEYIPEELLPTFNSNVIENFLWRLDDLSNNYILCNDDTLFMNRIPAEMFFICNLPVLSGNKKDLGYFPDNNLYWNMLNNNMRLEEQYCNYLGEKMYRWDHMHLMVPHQKAFEKLIWDANYDFLYQSLAVSKFRSSKNITHLLFNDLCEILHHCVFVPTLYNRSLCVNIKDNFNVYCLDRCDLACYNDTSQLKDYDAMKEKLLNHLDELFSEVSSFEVK